MNKNFKLVAGAITGLGFALAMTGCGSSSTTSSEAASGLTPIKVIAVPVVDVAALYVGEDQGFFEDEGIDLEVSFAEGSALVPGVVSGEFDFGYTSTPSLLRARDQGLPLVAVAEGGRSTGVQGSDHGAILTEADSSIGSSADLEGKTVAINQIGSLHEIATRASISKAGGDPEKTKFVELGLGDMPAALEAGRIDAAATSEPFVSMMKDNGAKLVASQFVDADPEFITAAYFATESKISQDSELAKAFNRAVNESLEYSASHEPEVREALLEFTEIDPELAKTMVLTKFDSTFPQESMERFAGVMADMGLVEPTVDVDGLMSFVNSSR